MKDKIFLTPLFDFGKWHIREREEAGGGGIKAPETWLLGLAFVYILPCD